METDYLTLDRAFQFIDECRNHGKKVYGIERFFCDNSGNTPDLDGIVDFSAIHSVHEITLSATSFLSQYGKESRERFKITF